MNGWLIFLLCLLCVTVLIALIMLIPIHIILNFEENSKFSLTVRILFFKFNENSFKKSQKKKRKKPQENGFKKLLGLDRFEIKNIKETFKTLGFFETVKRTFKIVADLIKEFKNLLSHFTVNEFRVNIVCAEENAADTAISYGKCSAVIYPSVKAIDSLVHIKKENTKINISCDYLSEKSHFDLKLDLSVRVFYLVKTLFNVTLNEAKRQINNKNK